jgi:microcystin-dependent protein
MDNGTIVPTGFGGFVDAGGGNIDRVPGTEADTVGGSSGQSTTIIGVNNLPNHEHNMIGTEGQQYYAIRSDTSIPADSGAILDRGPTVANQAQLLPSSGFIKTEGALGQPFNVMNPFITLNYIIRSGFPAF